MSRIGNKPISIANGATVTVADGSLTATGPKGTLTVVIRPEVKVTSADGKVIVERRNENPKSKSVQGLTRTLIDNAIMGVTQGWNKGLELVGVGYRAALQGTTLVLNVGFSHQVNFPAPTGITFEVKDNVKINVMGNDKQLVGETAAQIRRVKPPEPYKGKGIRYSGEVVRKKAGKTAKAAGGPAK